MFGIGKKKAKLKEFVNDLENAVIHIYADKVTIDCKSPSEFDTMKGTYGELIVKLTPGVHTIRGIHRTTEISKNYKTGQIENEISVEANHEYNFGIYAYSKEYLEANKDDPRMQYTYYYPMEAHGKKFGIICFIER
ncbi:MAG: hypothetical protein ACK5LC_18440 [Coprobacillaceae bacterium]